MKPIRPITRAERFADALFWLFANGIPFGDPPTLSEVSERSGLSEKTLRLLLESGDAASADLYKLACFLLKINPEYVVDGIGGWEPEGALSLHLASGTRDSLFSVVRFFTEDELRSVLEFARKVARPK